MSAEANKARGMIGRIVLGRYRILRHLADGGMGAIYLARSEGAGGFMRPVVVKCVLPSHIGDAKMVKLFAREARIMSNLRHPGIVSVIDFAQDEEMHIMVMDYVHGFHLGRWQKFTKRIRGDFPVDIGVHITVQILRALHYAHSLKGPDGTPLNIVHRDVTPSNVLVDVEGHVKLADFGIAQMSTDRTEVGKRAIKGKFPYLAPEILENADPSPATDVYSAGVTLHELLIGRNEFTASGVPAIVSRVLRHEPTPVDQVRPDAPPGLAPVIAKALSKKPEARYRTAAEFAEALASARPGSEDEVAKKLAQMASADFRDPRMAEMLAVPQLNELESDWTTPVSSLSDLTDPDIGVAEQIKVAYEDTAAGLDMPDDDYGAYDRPDARKRPTTTSGPLDRTLAASPGAIAEKPGGEAAGGAPRWAIIGGALALAAVGAVAVAALLKSSNEAQPADGPAYVVVSDREDDGAGPADPEPPAVAPADAAAAAVAPPAAPPDAAPAVEKSPVEKSPRLDPRTATARRLTRTFGKRKRKVAACFETHAVDLKGAPQMSIRFKVSADGAVQSAEILPASIQPTGLGQCLLRVARTTEFGKQSKTVTFRVPIKARVR